MSAERYRERCVIIDSLPERGISEILSACRLPCVMTDSQVVYVLACGRRETLEKSQIV